MTPHFALPKGTSMSAHSTSPPFPLRALHRGARRGWYRIRRCRDRGTNRRSFVHIALLPIVASAPTSVVEPADHHRVKGRIDTFYALDRSFQQLARRHLARRDERRLIGRIHPTGLMGKRIHGSLCSTNWPRLPRSLMFQACDALSSGSTPEASRPAALNLRACAIQVTTVIPSSHDRDRTVNTGGGPHCPR